MRNQPRLPFSSLGLVAHMESCLGFTAQTGRCASRSRSLAFAPQSPGRRLKIPKLARFLSWDLTSGSWFGPFALKMRLFLGGFRGNADRLFRTSSQCDSLHEDAMGFQWVSVRFPKLSHGFSRQFHCFKTHPLLSKALEPFDCKWGKGSCLD